MKIQACSTQVMYETSHAILLAYVSYLALSFSVSLTTNTPLYDASETVFWTTPLSR